MTEPTPSPAPLPTSKTQSPAPIPSPPSSVPAPFTEIQSLACIPSTPGPSLLPSIHGDVLPGGDSPNVALTPKRAMKFAVKSLQKRQTPAGNAKKRGKAVKRSFGECLTEDEVVLTLQTEEKEKQKTGRNERKKATGIKKEKVAGERSSKKEESTCTEKENGTKENKVHS